MKRKSLFFVLLTILFVSCEQGADVFRGEYTFKSSGSVTLLENGKQEPIVVDWETEFGQMDIVATHQDSERLLVTMNIFGGDMLTIPATEKEGILVLDTISRPISLRINGITHKNIRVDMYGQGERHEDMLLFYLDMRGDITILNHTYSIVESQVKCVAIRNDD